MTGRNSCVLFALSLLGVLNAGVAQAQLVAHWTFDESSGTTAHDSTGNYDGTLFGGATFVSGGISGNAISLNRDTNDLVNMGTSVPGFTDHDFTLITWVKTTDAQQQTFVAAKHEAGFYNGYIVGINSDGAEGVQNKAFAYNGGPPSTTPISTSDVNDNRWHQLVNMRQGNTSYIYVDGVLEASTSAANSPANSAPFLIGGINFSGVATNRYTGLVDDVQLYSSGLSAGQVQYLFNRPGSVVPAPGALMTAVMGGLPGAGLLLRRRRR